MTLLNLIRSNDEANAAATEGKWPLVVDILTAKTVEQRSSGRTTFKEFIELFGLDTTELVLAGWSTSEVGKSLRNQLEVIGLDFSDSQTIELIDKLDSQSKWPTGIAEKLKGLGVWLASPAERAGLADPTAEECEKSYLSAGVSDWFVAQSAVITERLAAGTITTRDEVAALISGAV